MSNQAGKPGHGEDDSRDRALRPSRFDSQPAIVTENATSRPELFRSFDARPPSLYVTLAPGAWEGLGEAERRGLVDELVRAGTSSGYVGILVRSGEERPVARWLEARGVEMIRHGEEPAGP